MVEDKKTGSVPKSAEELIKETQEYLEKYRGFQIIDNKQYVGATDVLKDIKSYKNRMEMEKRSILRPLDEARDRVVSLFRPVLDRLDTLEKSIKKSMTIYKSEVDKKRKQEEEEKKRKAREEEDRIKRDLTAKAAEEEIKRKELEIQRAEEEIKRKELEKQRVEAERLENGEEAKVLKERENASKKKELELQAQGEAARQNAENLNNQKDLVVVEPEPVTIQKAPKVPGIGYINTYDYKVVDFDVVPKEWLMIDDKKVRQAIRQSKGQIEIPGIEIYQDQSVRSRSY